MESIKPAMLQVKDLADRLFSICLNPELTENEEALHVTHLEIGSWDSLIDALHKPQNDTSMKSILDKLNTAFDTGIPKTVEKQEEIGGLVALSGVECMEIFRRDYNNLKVVVKVLERNEPIVHSAIDVLSRLILHKPKETVLVVCNIRYTRILDHLFYTLRECNETLQNKLFSFFMLMCNATYHTREELCAGNTFQYLFDFVERKGYVRGGIGVYNCLQLLKNILLYQWTIPHQSTISHFCEAGGIDRLIVVLKSINPPPWSEDERTNVFSLLEIARIVFQPSPLSRNVLKDRQTSYTSTDDMLMEILRLFFLPGFPEDMTAFFLCMIGEILRDHARGQELFNDICGQKMSHYDRNLPRFLVGMAFDEQQGISMRTAAVYCLQCCLFKDVGNNKTNFVQAVLSVACGKDNQIEFQMFYDGLTSADNISLSIASSAIFHALIDNPNKLALIEMPVRIRTTGSSLPLLEYVAFFALKTHTTASVRLDMLAVLSACLADCPVAVSQFLNSPQDYIGCIAIQLKLVFDDEDDKLLSGMLVFVIALCFAYGNEDDSDSRITKNLLRNWIVENIGVYQFFYEIKKIYDSKVYKEAENAPRERGDMSRLWMDFELFPLYQRTLGIVYMELPKCKCSFLWDIKWIGKLIGRFQNPMKVKASEFPLWF